MALLPFGGVPPPWKKVSTQLTPASSTITSILLNPASTLIGGTGATDYFSMSSNSSTPNTVSIRSNSSLEMVPTNITRTASGLKYGILWSGTITNDYATNSVPRAIDYSPTITLNQSSSAIVFAQVFGNSAVVQNTSGVVANWGPLFVLLSGTTYRADAAAIVSPSGMQDIRIAPTFTTVNSGTYSQSAHYGTFMTATISGDAQVKTKVHHHSGALTIAGNGFTNTFIAYSSDSITQGRDFNYSWFGGTGLFKHSDDLEIDSLGTKGLVLHPTTDTRYRYIAKAYTGALQSSEVSFDPFVDMPWHFVTDARAANVGSVADGADITRWIDKSGNGFDLTIGSGTDVPIYDTVRAELNSQPAVEFTSANSQSLENDITDVTVSTQDYSFVAVVSFKTVASIMRIVGTNTGNNVRGFGISATPNWTTNVGATAASAGTPATATRYFVRIYATTTSHTIFINEVSTATTATTALNVGVIVVGAGKNNTPVYANYFNGYLAFLGLYLGDITAHPQYARLLEYMNTTYGFTLTTASVAQPNPRTTLMNINANTTGVGNVGAGEDDLMTYAIPGSFLNATNDTVTFKMSGTIANTANNKRLRIKYGGTTMVDTGAAAITVSTAQGWTAEGQIFRTGAATQDYWCRVQVGTTLFNPGIGTAAETLTNPITLKATGEATANNDITQETLDVDI